MKDIRKFDWGFPKTITIPLEEFQKLLKNSKDGNKSKEEKKNDN